MSLAISQTSSMAISYKESEKVTPEIGVTFKFYQGFCSIPLDTISSKGIFMVYLLLSGFNV